MEKDTKKKNVSEQTSSRTKKVACCSFCGRKLEAYEPAVKGLDGSILCMNCGELAHHYFLDLQAEFGGDAKSRQPAPELELKKPEEQALKRLI